MILASHYCERDVSQTQLFVEPNVDAETKFLELNPDLCQHTAWADLQSRCDIPILVAANNRSYPNFYPVATIVRVPPERFGERFRFALYDFDTDMAAVVWENEEGGMLICNARGDVHGRLAKGVSYHRLFPILVQALTGTNHAASCISSCEAVRLPFEPVPPNTLGSTWEKHIIRGLSDRDVFPNLCGEMVLGLLQSDNAYDVIIGLTVNAGSFLHNWHAPVSKCGECGQAILAYVNDVVHKLFQEKLATSRQDIVGCTNTEFEQKHGDALRAAVRRLFPHSRYAAHPAHLLRGLFLAAPWQTTILEPGGTNICQPILRSLQVLHTQLDMELLVRCVAILLAYNRVTRPPPRSRREEDLLYNVHKGLFE